MGFNCFCCRADWGIADVKSIWVSNKVKESTKKKYNTRLDWLFMLLTSLSLLLF